MVAISLYKGNLHTVPDVPHRWPRPTPSISLKDFKVLLRRRARALSRLRSSTRDDADNIGTISSPSPNPELAGNGVNDNGVDNNIRSESELRATGDLKEAEAVKEEGGAKLIEGEESLRKLIEKTDALVKEEKKENVKSEDKTEIRVYPVEEKSKMEDGTTTSDMEKRKKEVKEKLEILNEKKHSLVQVLKQILNAEEQLKRQNSGQGRPPLPVQVDTDSGSMTTTRLNTPRMGSEMEGGGEADDVSNNIMQLSRRINSTSPSSDSQHRSKPSTSNMVPHTYRTTLGVASSPSRFAPAGQGQGQSLSVTSYIASSPSPAASGGTSVFRDARIPSPWN